MLKADSGSHGDDHFFPGPTDAAWDLAGAIVEWRMNSAQSEYFLETYRRRSGDEAKLRINDFIIAYTVFRSAYCTMAANALEASFEAVRLQQAASEYLGRLSSLLPNHRILQPLPESRAA
jgi:thiamine kinase-like enzyme